MLAIRDGSASPLTLALSHRERELSSFPIGRRVGDEGYF
jgi:hypothetical protein